MLVALTARTRRRAAAAAERLARRTRRSAASCARCRRPASPARPARSACDVLALADRDLAAVGVEQDRAAAAGAGVDREQQRVAHAATRPRSATFVAAARPRRSARSRRRSSSRRAAASRAWRRRCGGVSTTFSWRSSGCGPRRRAGLDDVERRAAQAAGAERVVERVLVDERLARGVDEVAPGFIGASARRRTGSVSAVARACSETKSDRRRAARRASPTCSTPSPSGRRRTGRRRATVMPNASRAAPPAADLAVTDEPERVAAEVVAEELRALERRLADRCPPARNRCAFGSRRASMTRNASVRSATASAFFPGVVTTGMPRSASRRRRRR